MVTQTAAYQRYILYFTSVRHIGILFLLKRMSFKEFMSFKAHSNKCEWKDVATARKTHHNFTLGCKSKGANFRKLAEQPLSQLFFHNLLTGCQGWKRLLTLRVQLHGNGSLRRVGGIRPYSLFLWRKTSFKPRHASRRGGSEHRGRQILTLRGYLEQRKTEIDCGHFGWVHIMYFWKANMACDENMWREESRGNGFKEWWKQCENVLTGLVEEVGAQWLLGTGRSSVVSPASANTTTL